MGGLTVESTRILTPLSTASFFILSAYLQKIVMRVETSTASRRQFSVEKAYTVNCPPNARTLASSMPSTTDRGHAEKRPQVGHQLTPGPNGAFVSTRLGYGFPWVEHHGYLRVRTGAAAR
jgi:hypothetical protein